MLGKLLGKIMPEKSAEDAQAAVPSILGLRLGFSFDIDPLVLKLLEKELVVTGSATTHIIQSVGKVVLDGMSLFRFYTDDEAFLQVVAQGGEQDTDVVDVKLYHYFDTLDVSSEQAWDQLLYREIGCPTYALEGHHYQRVWTAVEDYHAPVHMVEKTYDAHGAYSVTDQFTMLFERPIADNQTESLFLSAEEKEEEAGYLSRCFVLSTGITLTPTQITIHG